MKKLIKSFDVLTFVVILAIDFSLKWTTSDLVWSFWLSSISVGYLVIVTSALRIPGTINSLINNKNVKTESNINPKHIVLGSFAISLFLIGFFSVHFLGFHIVHASFLKSAFPLEGFEMRSRGFIDFNFLISIFKILIPLYWPMVLVSFINKREFFFPSKDEFNLHKIVRSFGFGPYKNVIKVHVLIFIIFGLKEASVDRLTTHLIVLIIFSINFNFGESKFNKIMRRRKMSPQEESV
jgi:hypothetical protein